MPPVPPASVHVRRLEPLPEVAADVQALLEASPGYFDAVHGHPPGPDEARELFAALPPGRSDEDKRVLGLYEGPRLIGVAEVVRGWNAPHKAIIGLLLIAGDRQRSGLGGTFEREVEREIGQWPEIDTVRIGVIRTNVQAFAFWRRLGFVETGEVKPGPPAFAADIVVLEKPLERPMRATSGDVIEVHALTPARRDDYLGFFDHERGAAFADNPEWARCYCHFYHVPKALNWGAFTAVENRTAMDARIRTGEMEGFLAYASGEVVGWMNAQPLSKLPHCWERLGIERPALPTPSDAVAAIVCFVIAPAWRRRGVARALLEGGLAHCRARGIERVYAFPFNVSDGDESPTAHYHGPARLFAACGFQPAGGTDDLTVVVRDLAPT